jgi:HAMP domain-containing protein
MIFLAVIGAALATVAFSNLWVSFALIGRLRSLDSLAHAGSAGDAKLPRPGERVRPFRATTADGQLVTADRLEQGATLVGFFSPDCRECKRVVADLFAHPPTFPMFAVVEGHPGLLASSTLVAELGRLGLVAYGDDNDGVRQAFQLRSFPTLVRTQDGTVAAAGHQLSDVLPEAG